MAFCKTIRPICWKKLRGNVFSRKGMQTAFFALVFEYDKDAIDWIARKGPSWLRNQAMFSTPEGVLVLIAGLACEENARIQRENIQTLYNAMRARWIRRSV